MSIKKILFAVLALVITYLLLAYVTHDIRQEHVALFFLNLVFLFISITYAAFTMIETILLWLKVMILAYGKRGKLIKQQINEIETILSRPGKPFPINRNLMRNISRRIDAEQNINILFHAIMAHMGLSKNSLELYIVHSQFDSFQAGGSRAGQYQKSYYGASEVELMLRKDYNSYTIAAILAHECAHHLLEQLQLVATSPEVLEIRTDIATVYTGFGKIIDKGYHGTYSKAKQMRIRLGYLNKNEFAFVKFLTATTNLRRKRGY